MAVDKPIKLAATALAESAERRVIPPFDPSQSIDEEPPFDINPFIPRRDSEQPPAQGVDLAGKAKVIFAAGRGKTGKTTLLRWMAESALRNSATVLMADIDPTNASFASYFKGVARPNTDDPAGVSRWLQGFIEHAVRHRATAMIDLGGGDTTLRTLAAEMPGFVQQIEAEGLTPVAFYLVGTQPDDLAPVATLAQRGFNPRARAIVLNEAAAEPGLSREQAFARIGRTRVLREQSADGAIVLWMPRLHAADAVESRRSGFVEARDGQTVPPLGLFDRARVRAWLDAMDKAFSGVRSWMP